MGDVAFEIIEIEYLTEGSSKRVRLGGRALFVIKENDTLYYKRNGKIYKVLVKEILFFRKTIDQIEPAHGCQLIVEAEVQFMERTNLFSK